MRRSIALRPSGRVGPPARSTSRLLGGRRPPGAHGREDDGDGYLAIVSAVGES